MFVEEETVDFVGAGTGGGRVAERRLTSPLVHFGHQADPHVGVFSSAESGQ